MKYLHNYPGKIMNWVKNAWFYFLLMYHQFRAAGSLQTWSGQEMDSFPCARQRRQVQAKAAKYPNLMPQLTRVLFMETTPTSMLKLLQNCSLLPRFLRLSSLTITTIVFFFPFLVLRFPRPVSYTHLDVYKRQG